MSDRTRNQIHSKDAFDVIRDISCVTSRPRDVPNKIRVTFRQVGGAVGSRDIATHWLHSYPAKMFHRIPQQILMALESTKGRIVLDPFCGSGTVLIEAALRGNNAIGIDVNPLARLLSKVKSTPLPTSSLERSSKQIVQRARKCAFKPPSDPLLDFWFKESAKTSIYHLVSAIDNVRNPEYRNFFYITLSSIIRRCSLADPSIPPPVRLSYSRCNRANLRYKKDYDRIQNMTADSVYEQFEIALEKNIRRVDDLNRHENLGSVKLLGQNAEAAKTTLEQNSVDFILTSPPYCGSQKYVRTLRLEMYWLGYSKEFISEIDAKTLGTERVRKEKKLQKLLSGDHNQDRLIHQVWQNNQIRATMLSNYLLYLNQFAAECSRVIRPGGDIFVTFGTFKVTGIEIDMAELFKKMSIRNGLHYVTTLIDTIPSRGLLTQRHSSANTILDEQVVWLKG